MCLPRGEEEYTLHENARFQFNGAMLDNSRNSVLNLKTAKEMVMYAALWNSSPNKPG